MCLLGQLVGHQQCLDSAHPGKDPWICISKFLGDADAYWSRNCILRTSVSVGSVSEWRQWLLCTTPSCRQLWMAQEFLTAFLDLEVAAMCVFSTRSPQKSLEWNRCLLSASTMYHLFASRWAPTVKILTSCRWKHTSLCFAFSYSFYESASLLLPQWFSLGRNSPLEDILMCVSVSVHAWEQVRTRVCACMCMCVCCLGTGYQVLFNHA